MKNRNDYFLPLAVGSAGVPKRLMSCEGEGEEGGEGGGGKGGEISRAAAQKQVNRTKIRAKELQHVREWINSDMSVHTAYPCSDEIKAK